MRTPLALALLVAMLPATRPIPEPATQGYYRSPAMHGETIVFTAEGDLWTASTRGGEARRLTTHPAEELHAAISPDGSELAFSASYEGPTEVYTMPLAGGLPRRRTWEGAPATVVGWTPDGRILYATDAILHPAVDPARHHRPARPAAASCSRSPKRATAASTPPAARSTSPATRSRGATPSATRAARRRTSGDTRAARRGGAAHRRLSPARAGRRCGGTAASTSPPTATAP